MAFIRKRKDKYVCEIRKKGKEMYATFHDEETAKAWGEYKERLIDELEAFNPPEEELITLYDAIDMKIASMDELSHRSKQDVILLKETFADILQFNMKQISFDWLYEFFTTLMERNIRKGGGKDGKTGVFKKPERATVVRKFRILSTVYGFLIEKGVNIENMALKVLRRIENV